MKRALASATLVIVAVAVGLAIMEIATRLIIPQQLVRDYVVPDTQLGSHLRPHANYHDRYGHDYFVRTNGAGFRMPEEVDRSPNRLRIMTYGDSFTFGFGVNYEDSYFARIKRRIEGRRPAFQLLNAAIPAFSSGHVKIQMERHIPRFHPAAIIYFFNNNDVFENAITDIDYRVTAYSIAADGTVTLTDKPPFAPWKRFLLHHTPYGWLNRHSHLFVAVKGAFKNLIHWKRRIQEITLDTSTRAAPEKAVMSDAGNAPAYTISEPQKAAASRRKKEFIAITLAHMQRIRALAAKHGIPLIVVWVPAWEEIFRRDLDLPMLHLLKDVRSRFTTMFAGDGGRAAFIDTVRLLPPVAALKPQEKKLHFITKVTATGFSGDGHFNVAGNRWFADLVTQPIAEKLNDLLPPRSHRTASDGGPAR